MNEPVETPVTPVTPVCPFCSTEMQPQHFNGYYESFAMWSCECDEIPGAEHTSGCYA